MSKQNQQKQMATEHLWITRRIITKEEDHFTKEEFFQTFGGDVPERFREAVWKQLLDTNGGTIELEEDEDVKEGLDIGAIEEEVAELLEDIKDDLKMDEDPMLTFKDAADKVRMVIPKSSWTMLKDYQGADNEKVVAFDDDGDQYSVIVKRVGPPKAKKAKTTEDHLREAFGETSTAVFP